MSRIAQARHELLTEGLEPRGLTITEEDWRALREEIGPLVPSTHKGPRFMGLSVEFETQNTVWAYPRRRRSLEFLPRVSRPF